MQMEALRTELEQLFELQELIHLTSTLLGFDPEEIGDTDGKAAYVRALTAHCSKINAIEALCEAVVASKPHVSRELSNLRFRGISHDEELPANASFGPFEIVDTLGKGATGICYTALHGGRRVRLKVLRRATSRDQAGLQRLLTQARLIGQLDFPGLPRNVNVGRVGDQVFIAHDWVEGQSLASRIAERGPLHWNEAREIVVAVLRVLSSVHQARLVWGNLKLENVLVHEGTGEAGVTLLDFGGDTLRARVPANGHIDLLQLSSPKTVSPEQLRGDVPGPRSDLYALGAILYEILTGTPLFPIDKPMDAAVYHLTGEPQPPSSAAAGRWIPRRLDELVLSLLAKDPSVRPRHCDEVLERVLMLGEESRAVALSEEEIARRIEALLTTPDSVDAAVAVESAAHEGADPQRIAQALVEAAANLAKSAEAGTAFQTVKLLNLRAARLLQGANALSDAEQILLSVLAIDNEDKNAELALEDVRRKLGKFDEIVESLLARAESVEERAARAEIMAKIGRIYEQNLQDGEQALVAYTQAIVEKPEADEYAANIERLAAKDTARWTEVLSTLTDTAGNASASPYRNELLLRMAAWYPNIQRLDLTVSCLQAVLADDPTNSSAWAGLADLYRKAQQWPELSKVLVAYAEVAGSPELARTLRAEAADIAEARLSDSASARVLYEQILSEDPAHPRALDGLGRIYERTGEHSALLGLLKGRLARVKGPERLLLRSRIAELCEDRLGDADEAKAQYQAILTEDADHLEALRGLDRIYSRQGEFKALLQNLERQQELAATPRQRITLLTRTAAIHDEEFLDHAQAAQALEQILKIDATHEATLAELGRHYRALERWEDLVRVYGLHAKHTSDDATRMRSLLEQARVLGGELGAPERAIAAYEAILAVDPTEPQALEALARLRESSGDADQALRAILVLAEKADTAEAKAEHYLRAARLYLANRDLNRATECFKQALDAQPRSTAALAGLREAYAEQGNVRAAIEVLQRQIEITEGGNAKAKLAVNLADLLRDQLGDGEGAEKAARQALQWDSANEHALLIVADAAFAAGRFVDSNAAYANLAARSDSLPREMAIHVLNRQIDALFEQGSIAAGLQSLEALLRFAPNDLEISRRAATLAFEHAPAQRAGELCADLLQRFGAQLSSADLVTFTYRLGESLRKSDQLELAIATLEEATDLAPGSKPPLEALAAAHASRHDWNRVLDIKHRLLDLASGEERAQLMIEIGELWNDQLKDSVKATKIFEAALAEHPDNRKLLTRLMQIYSETKDWAKLSEIVVKLANFVEDPAQKAKYLITAAMLEARELGNPAQALALYAQVLALDPNHAKALSESIELERNQGNLAGVERLLKQRLKSAHESGANDVILATLMELGRLYQEDLGRIDAAVEAYESALGLAPENLECVAALTALYESNLGKYAEKSITLQSQSLRRDPYRAEAYKQLRRIYTESRRADPAWCLCQALYVLKLADAGEEQFFKRMRSDDPAYARAVLTEDDWRLLTHPEADPSLTALFALIEPVAVAARGRPLAELGYHPAQVLDLSDHPNPLAQTLYYAAGVLGISAPPTFENQNAPAALAFLQAEVPVLVLGEPSLGGTLSPQLSAFITGHQLAYLRPGFYLRCLLPSITGLKSWLFAAVKLISPQFPVAPELSGPVEEAVTALQAHLTPAARDQLAVTVSRLLRNTSALDLKKWVAAVDLTADRVGFVLAHDLETAIESIRAFTESEALPTQQRLKELVLFAISEPYFGVRQHLGIGVDA